MSQSDDELRERFRRVSSMREDLYMFAVSAYRHDPMLRDAGVSEEVFLAALEAQNIQRYCGRTLESIIHDTSFQLCARYVAIFVLMGVLEQQGDGDLSAVVANFERLIDLLDEPWTEPQFVALCKAFGSLDDEQKSHLPEAVRARFLG